MKIQCGFVSLHGPLFLGGKNFGQKLDINKFKDIQMTYDRNSKELEITYKSITAYLPNIEYYIPIEVAPKPLEQEYEKRGPGRPKLNAQVSTPTSHVFKNEPGLIRDKR